MGRKVLASFADERFGCRNDDPARLGYRAEHRTHDA